jgi:hypothetical protein
MTLGLLLISDGRPCHLESAVSLLRMPRRFDQVVWVDDHDHELGFAGAIQAGWDQLKTDWIFHWECDFVLRTRSLQLDRMIRLLQTRAYLKQVALKRQPVNPPEVSAGGVVELHPDQFVERRNYHDIFTEHRAFFTTNPSVYHRRITADGWPQVPHSEGIFTHRLLEDPDAMFAYWGGKYDPPKVWHIGDRTGVGY